ncbi:LAMI_0F00584g1_1 [Lachancea mirantina]|uniref:LAMI_0F00584g1_1 n=1 Tax=Lachancea mirantina TaxID=1230905 RepID=A0A1G4JVF3_9SACH|nr:LAMI_0F00584g1_1 [Lachancea mirantina]
MCDTERLEVPKFNNETTPLRRGHRHKRSLAISEDFDFLRQSCGDESPRAGLHSSTTSPRKNDLSPRFFMSEESTLSHGVPEAIIDLDAALSAKPKSFAAHRRTESAPATLNLSFRPDISPTEAPCIEEEDCEEESESPQLLLSPLGTVSQPPILSNPASPIRKEEISNNTLKINRQKERYYHYARQLPSASSQTPLELRMKQSSSSSITLETPSTPQRLTSSRSNSGSPALPPNTFAVNSPRTHTTFKYESQMYDVPLQYQLKREDNGLNNDNQLFANAVPNTSKLHRKSKSLATYDRNSSEMLPDDVLRGQPGDMVDLSSNGVNGQFKDLSKKDFLVSNPNISSTATAVTDPRSASDSLVDQKKSCSSGNKKRNRNNFLSALVARFRSRR